MSRTEETVHEHALRIAELIQELDVMMLTTVGANGLISTRPMAVANDEDEREETMKRGIPPRLTCITNRRNELLEDIVSNSQVGVSLQKRAVQCFLRGNARISEDRARLKMLWSAATDVWFEHGADDPLAVLVEIEITSAEYWDQTGAAGLRFAWESGKALLTGERIDFSKAGRHAELDEQQIAHEVGKDRR